MTKTPEQMAEDWLLGRWYAVHDPTISGESKVAFLAGYKAAKEEEATKDQKIAELWTESIRRMLPSVHEITLFSSKQSEEK